MKNFLKTQCANCKYYHGVRYRGELFVCANHPQGQEDCTDFSKMTKVGLKKRLLLELKSFLWAYLSYSVLTVPILSSLIIVNEVYEKIILDSFSISPLIGTLLMLIILAPIYQIVIRFMCRQINPTIRLIYHSLRRDLTDKSETVLVAGLSLSYLSSCLVLLNFYQHNPMVK